MKVKEKDGLSFQYFSFFKHVLEGAYWWIVFEAATSTKDGRGIVSRRQPYK
jgi:hypothetical protein